MLHFDSQGYMLINFVKKSKKKKTTKKKTKPPPQKKKKARRTSKMRLRKYDGLPLISFLLPIYCRSELIVGHLQKYLKNKTVGVRPTLCCNSFRMTQNQCINQIKLSEKGKKKTKQQKTQKVINH